MINNIVVALALASAASAAPLARRDECQDAYKACIAAGTPEVACSCTLTACVGEDNARNREYCASATASLSQPSKTEIPGGCNPAHPGSCPSSYFTYTQTAPVETFTSIPGIPGGCNPAHPGSCPSSYFTYSKVTVTVDETSTVKQTFTSIPGIPGGCNPAHPGSCPSSYFTYPVASSTAAPPAPPAPAPTGGSGDVTYPSPKPVDGKSWSIKDLTRYCGEDNSGCDYNFAIEADGKTQRCTVIRMPGADAATESWSDQPCTDGSEYKVSWGYVTEPAPAFAVITVVKGKELAWFGVSDVNGQKVTPSNPFGSGQYGNFGPEPVYTY
ncbi:hypothetical protein NCS57_01280600 [Fusarium keratoplasticum]|uniref:Uncharacterized protein n=1 Tax=Fusarium keratoplasticum TaxID=1328300 RepID=A0ACC0QJ24_9HYPO|nr:hypothetical protein NCS57_01280600 [Fusarium keratoplasticum]KAI8655319.1 hypothetical protein NCS57_01280600 [Fusarium keratoplasticum]KAI8656151.1 hypothetical protein NCS55_01269900 [Fusarium keratoplasticum]